MISFEAYKRCGQCRSQNYKYVYPTPAQTELLQPCTLHCVYVYILYIT